MRIVDIEIREMDYSLECDVKALQLLQDDRVLVEKDEIIYTGMVLGDIRVVQGGTLPNNAKVIRKLFTFETGDKFVRYPIETESFGFCKKNIESLKLSMKLLRIKFLPVENKLVFYYSAEERVDFRELVKILASKFHLRIEMRQINIRDECRVLGGIGICGRICCCGTVVSEMNAITSATTKIQCQSTSKYVGYCGRLLCCLSFDSIGVSEDICENENNTPGVSHKDCPASHSEDYFYVTTPIYYANDKPHMGHAYSTVIADSAARFKRLSGYKVFFMTGTDEHGLKIEKEAEARGISPKELADSVHKKFKELFGSLGISYDRFIRTTDADHIKTVKTVFKKLLKKGDIYLSEYEGWYCTPCETFLTERSLDGGNCPQCGRPVSKVKEESYFLKLDKYEKRLLKYIENNPGFIKPDFRKNEVVSFIREGLKDLSISRTSFKCGISVPGNDKHVIYVWFDALLNYLTGLGYEDFLNGKNPDFDKFFKTANHIVGKDIIKFHGVYWPIMLFALDIDLPKTILAHGWWLTGGKKMSKSLGNAIDPDFLIDKFGADAVRFYLLNEITLGLDGDFNMDNFILRYNSGLANDLGNLVSRVIAMLKKYTGGKVPGSDADIDDGIIKKVSDILAGLSDRYDNYDFVKIIDNTFKFINTVNKYVNDGTPWKLNAAVEEDKKKLFRILRTSLMSIYCVSYLIYPFMPVTSKKINVILNTEPFDLLKSPLTPDDLVKNCRQRFKNGHKISDSADILFPRIK
ncbi:methionine--tRNA ligase [Candidatus Acidulodesulfobacterium sp. H_13]|uniref:methionine--tRNA ligase n=1 Tax=Candidatus Acidulodesulfobacterium sp. H_13 TaxID=3395470 RepID=UPI003AF9FB1A